MENNVKKEKIEWTPDLIIFVIIGLSFVFSVYAGCLLDNIYFLILGCICGLMFVNKYWQIRIDRLEDRIDELLEELRAYPEISDDGEYYP